MKFIDLANEVMELREEQGIRGRDRELSRLRCHIANAAFAEKDVTEIGAPDIREWLRAMAQKPALGYGPSRKLSRQTICRCESLVSAVFTEAIEREIITLNPCNGVKPKKRVDESDTEEKWAFLTIEEQRAIATCEAIPLADRLMIRFAIGTGLRQGEQRHLELPDLIVDGDDPRVIVRYAGRRKGRKLPPKSGKIRTVQLFGDGLAAAREWLALLPTYAPDNPENLVFPTPTGRLRQQGKPLGPSIVLKQHYQAAGIKLRKGLHWHALRHTCATNLVTGAFKRRWALEEVQIVMGHSSIMVTQRYAHVGKDAIKRAVAETVAATAPAPSLSAAGPEQVQRHLDSSGALRRIFVRIAARAKRAAACVAVQLEEVRYAA